MVKAKVLRELACEDSKCYVVVHDAVARDSLLKPCLVVDGWFENEDEARACAHRLEHPDYG